MTTTQPEPTSLPVPARVEVSLLVPVKDEVDSLDQLTAEIHAAMAGTSWELVYIDDGSSDGSCDKMTDLADQYPEVRAIRMRRNFGKSAALRAGLAETTGGIVATISCCRRLLCIIDELGVLEGTPSFVD